MSEYAKVVDEHGKVVELEVEPCVAKFCDVHVLRDPRGGVHLCMRHDREARRVGDGGVDALRWAIEQLRNTGKIG